MTTDEHNKTLSTLYFIYGAMHGLTLAGLLLLVVVVKLAALGTGSISTFWVGLGVVLFIILLFVVGLIPLAVGYALKKRRRWAKPLGLSLRPVPVPHSADLLRRASQTLMEISIRSIPRAVLS